MKIRNDLLRASDKGLMSVLVFLDLIAAFDTVGNHILILKMEKLFGNNKGSVLNLFGSYLSDLSQFVKVNNESTAPTVVYHRVSQGSVLDPILFILYMPLHGSIFFSMTSSYITYGTRPNPSAPETAGLRQRHKGIDD